MKVTSIKPLIVSNNAKELIETYNALGFKEKHYNDDIQNSEADCTILGDENGNKIYISSLDDIPHEMTVIHINVDNFDEARKLFESKGYSCPSGQTRKNSTSISMMLVSKTGTSVVICQHLK